MNKKVKEIAGLYNKRNINMLVDTMGKPIIDEKKT